MSGDLPTLAFKIASARDAFIAVGRKPEDVEFAFRMTFGEPDQHILGNPADLCRRIDWFAKTVLSALPNETSADVMALGAERRRKVMTRLSMALQVIMSVVIGLFIAPWPVAHAEGIEYLMVPSPSMGRDIPVAFRGGGPHVVVLLDAFNASPEVSGWVGAGGFDALAGQGVSVAAPAGGAWSLYTDWEMDGSKQWERFLSTELPDWLAANKGAAPGGHAIVGASQGGTAAVTLAAFHPARYRYAGSMSGFMTPSNTSMNGALTAGMARFGGVNTQAMWGAAQLGRWKWHDPAVHVQLLADNNIRLWVYSPGALGCSDPAAMIGYCDQAQGSNRSFYQDYRRVGGNNGHFDIGAGGQHDWASWGSQLVAMSADLTATIG